MKLKLLLLLITSVILLTILIIKRLEVTQFLTRIKNRIFEKEETHTTRREQNPNGKAIYGIDVSNHQGKIEWSKVREWKGHPIQFVYIKATEGETHQDKSYARNLEGARKNGLRVGSYHYFKTTSTVEEKDEYTPSESLSALTLN